MRRRAALAVATAALIGVPAATASDATSAQVAALAARAGTDAEALASLRAIDRVDGRRVDLAAALDASGPALASRLRALRATTGATAASDAADPRASARAILAERRFHGSTVPRPLHRPLEWLGRQLHRLYDAINGRLPGDGGVFWTLVAAAVAVAAALAAVRLGRRRAGLTLEKGRAARTGGGNDPRRLEREADEAERDGDYERALRLRFQAGLLRLAQKDAIPKRTSLTNGEIARRLGSSSFRGLAADFDEVVYGRRAAAIEHVSRAREDWPIVLEEAVRR